MSYVDKNLVAAENVYIGLRDNYLVERTYRDAISRTMRKGF
jgi:prefoldin subunit 5